VNLQPSNVARVATLVVETSYALVVETSYALGVRTSYFVLPNEMIVKLYNCYFILVF
jgi:hypothetical protein